MDSPAERRRVGSILERLATGERTRPWLVGAAGMCLLIGVLPRTIRRCSPSLRVP
ncbi:MAG: hypothetical protein ACKVU4_00450 [Phycisphaerales bacterium]